NRASGFRFFRAGVFCGHYPQPQPCRCGLLRLDYRSCGLVLWRTRSTIYPDFNPAHSTRIARFSIALSKPSIITHFKYIRFRMNNRQFKQNVLTRSLNMIILSQLFLAPLTYAEDAVQQLDTIVITADQSMPYSSAKVNVEGFATDSLQKIPASVPI